jgi:hypothetical protein
MERFGNVRLHPHDGQREAQPSADGTDAAPMAQRNQTALGMPQDRKLPRNNLDSKVGSKELGGVSLLGHRMNPHLFLQSTL